MSHVVVEAPFIQGLESKLQRTGEFLCPFAGGHPSVAHPAGAFDRIGD